MDADEIVAIKTNAVASVTNVNAGIHLCAFLGMRMNPSRTRIGVEAKLYNSRHFRRQRSSIMLNAVINSMQKIASGLWYFNRMWLLIDDSNRR